MLAEVLGCDRQTPRVCTALADPVIQGPSVNQFDGALKAAPKKAPSGLDGEKFVHAAVETSDRWEKIITEEFRFKDATSWEGFDSWFAENHPDVDPLLERIVEETIAPYRPEA